MLGDYSLSNGDKKLSKKGEFIEAPKRLSFSVMEPAIKSMVTLFYSVTIENVL